MAQRIPLRILKEEEEETFTLTTTFALEKRSLVMDTNSLGNPNLFLGPKKNFQSTLSYALEKSKFMKIRS
jgi:hypothetical protein